MKFTETITHFGATIVISFSGVKSHTPAFFSHTHNCFFYPLCTAKQSEFDNLWMMIAYGGGGTAVAIVVAAALYPRCTSFCSLIFSNIFFRFRHKPNEVSKLIVSEPPL